MSLTDTTAQPAPKPNANQAVWDLVVQDMLERDKFGESKYGTRLQAFNGRDALVDAYQEALDLVVYLRTAIYERENGIMPKAVPDEFGQQNIIGGAMIHCPDCSAEHCPCVAR